jgi:molybdate transport system substrate-binding protein
LGFLTINLLREMDLHETVSRNIVVKSPTADLLVNQLRVGKMDVIIVYRANLSQVTDKLEIIEIKNVRTKAEQPIAICAESKCKFLSQRLVDAITSAKSAERFRKANFRWRIPNKTTP